MLKKKNKFGSYTLPDFRTYHKAAVIKTVWYWHHKDIYSSGIEIPDINFHTYSQMTFEQGVKIILCGKNSLFKNGTVKTGYEQEKMKLDPYVIQKKKKNLESKT